MKPKNFPGRKRLRRQSALERLSVRKQELERLLSKKEDDAKSPKAIVLQKDLRRIAQESDSLTRILAETTNARELRSKKVSVNRVRNIAKKGAKI